MDSLDRKKTVIILSGNEGVEKRAGGAHRSGIDFLRRDISRSGPACSLEETATQGLATSPTGVIFTQTSGVSPRLGGHRDREQLARGMDKLGAKRHSRRRQFFFESCMH